MEMKIQAGRPLLKTKRVKFFTRSFSLELYLRASALFQVEGIPCVRLTDQTADGYFFTMLADTTCDVAINVDEDAFIYDMDAVLDLAEYVLENNYANAGSPDCGPGSPRGGNPIVTNPFFNVFNLELIRSKWGKSNADFKESKTTVQHFNYDAVKTEMRAAFDCKLELQDPDYESIFCEPYYNFFFWLAYYFKTLYLPSYRHEDGFSTVLMTPDNRRICAHSWYSRRYKVVQLHTDRINRLMAEVYGVRGIVKPEFTNKDEWAFKRDLSVRYIVKCVTRVCNWPRKWRKWYLRWKRNRDLKKN